MAFLAAVGAIVGAVGTIMSGMAAADAAEYNAKVEERNASAARAQAGADASKEKRAGARRQAEIRAAYGANGMEMAGSALDVFRDQVIEDDLAVKTIIYKGEVRAIGHKDQAQLDRMRAKSSRTAAVFGGFSQAISGAGRAMQI